MRGERLTGFVIHQRAYREKRAIYTLFCEGVGIIDGIAKKGLLPFLPITFFATGKTALKTLTEPIYTQQTSSNHPHFPTFLSGQAYYAGLYLNELLYKILVKENPSDELWQSYAAAIIALSSLSFQDDKSQYLKLTLRRFELALFDELGVGLDWQTDWQDTLHYRFTLDLGFVPCYGSWDTGAIVLTADELYRLATLSRQLIKQTAVMCDESTLRYLGAIHKARIDELLDYRPLHSRRLWQDMMSLKTT